VIEIMQGIAKRGPRPYTRAIAGVRPHSAGLTTPAGAAYPFCVSSLTHSRAAEAREASSRTAWATALAGHAATLACVAHVSPAHRATMDWPASMGPVHAQLGALIWAERKRTTELSMHVYASTDHSLLAVLDVQTRQVDLSPRLELYAPSSLYVKDVPTLEGAPRPRGAVTTSLFNLLWHYAQTHADALAGLPGELGWRPLQLRRFPSVDARLLSVRHLAIFQYFSTGACDFATLQAEVPKSGLPWLCADLGALFITRALKVL
jgi:hypothetical protein